MAVVSTAAGAGARPASADEAIASLYAAQWRPLVRLTWLLVHDDGLAEDIVQDAFVATHRHWDRLRDPDRATAYLRRAVVNGARSALRHRGVEERYAATRSAPVLAAVPEDLATLRARTDDVMGVLAGLPARQREVLTLRYYLDLSEAEIAAVLGIARGSVKAHASRGLATLRARIGDPRTEGLS